MNTRMRGVSAALTVCALTASLAACGGLLGSDDSSSGDRKKKGDDVHIGLLLPEKETARYEKFDHPIVVKHVAELTHGKGTVTYANAGGAASRQSEQFKKMIDAKPDTIIVDPVSAKAIAPMVRKAKDAGIHVLAYDRLADGPVDGYITFDGELVGQVQGQALLQALGGGDHQKDKIVMMNGSSDDPNAALFKEGALAELQSNVNIVKSYDTAGWKPENARANMEKAIESVGAENIAGVYSANDGMAGGVIEALKDAGVTDMPPVTGQDAELSAVQRVVSGEQYMSVYKPYPDMAAAAAEMAVKISQGRMIEYDSMALDKSDSATEKNVPTHLVQVRPLTRKTIKSTVIEDHIYRTGEICTAEYAAACRAIGLTD